MEAALMNSKRLLVFTLALLAVLATRTFPVFAQANITGSIRGSVADDSGNFLPGATIVLSSTALGNSQRTAVTNAEGNFTINGLPVGVYSMTTTLLGYRPYEIVQIVVTLSLIHISEPTRLLSLSYAEFCLK